jgi:CBS domain-containing protein
MGGVMTKEPVTEELIVRGEDLVATVKELVHQGNIRRVAVKNKDGRVLLEVPLTLGVVGAILLPTLAALGALAALVTECTIVVERVGDSDHSKE